MKKILLVPDAVPPNPWCWYWTAKSLQQHAPEGVEVSICAHADFGQMRQLREFDAILHFAWSEAHFPFGANRYVTLLADHGCEATKRQSDWLRWMNVAGSPDSHSQAAAERLPRFDAIIALNEKLYNIGRCYNGEVYDLPVGVEDQVFQPGKKIRTEGELVVGWCGKHDDNQRRPKGYHEILKPLMERMQGSGITWKINGRGPSDALSRADMVEWYNGLDLFICTSICEGTPFTVFEAMGCGVPIVSTSIGEVSRAQSRVQYPQTIRLVGQYVDQDSADCVIEQFESALSWWMKHREYLSDAGQDCRRIVEDHYSWKVLAPRWIAAILGERT